MNGLSMVHQFYLDRVAQLLPNHRRLSNPYKPEENPALILRQGVGLTIGPASASKRTMNPILSITRSFSLVITREYMAREDDSRAKASIEKQIMEDAAVISSDIEANWTMDGLVLRARLVGDSGIEYVSTETDRFLKTVIDFEAEYFEVACDT